MEGGIPLALKMGGGVMSHGNVGWPLETGEGMEWILHGASRRNLDVLVLLAYYIWIQLIKNSKGKKVMLLLTYTM